MRSIGIEVNSSALRIVELEQRTEGARLTSAVTVPTFLFASQELAGSGDAARAALVAEVDQWLERYTQAGVHVRGGVTGITGRELMLRYVEVPEGDEKRQAIIIQFELDDLLEKAEEELIYDHTVLFDPDSAGVQTAALALAKDSYLQRIYDQLAELKLSPGRVTPSCLALYHAYLLGAEAEDEETVLLLSVGCEESEFCLVRKGVLVFARNLNVGLKEMAEILAEHKKLPLDKAYRALIGKTDVTPNERGSRDGTRLQVELWSQADELHRALESTLTFARIHLKEPGLNVNRVLLAGDLVKLTGGVEVMRQRFRQPVEVLDPFALLEERAKQPDVVRRGEWDPNKVPGCYAVATGLARIGLESQPGAAVNLESTAVKAKRNFLHRTVFLYAGALAVVLMLLWMIASTHELAQAADEQSRAIQGEEQAVRDLTQRLKQAEKEVRDAEPLVEALRATLEPTAHSLRVVYALREFANENPELIVEEISIEPPEDAGENAEMEMVVFFENKGRLSSRELHDLLVDSLREETRGAIRPGGLTSEPREYRDGFGDRYKIRAMLATPGTE